VDLFYGFLGFLSNKTCHLNIPQMLMKVALNTNDPYSRQAY
jgi:hypothetical protein